MKITLSNLSGVPLYEQIKEQIKAEILSGTLKEGEKLPSLRELARDLRISVLTTMRAYSELEQEGFISNSQGRGCYVLGGGSELMREHLLRDIEQNLLQAIRTARQAELGLDEIHKMINLLNEAYKDD